MDDQERLRQEILKPQLRTIRLKTPFALYTAHEGMPYKIISQDGEYCTFQEMTVSEAEAFRQSDTRLLEQRNGVSFIQCLEECIHTPEFVAEWERLSGKKIVAKSPLDRMIDEATGYDMAVFKEFADFVYQYVFLTMGPI